jgi:hypothetical protein
VQERGQDPDPPSLLARHQPHDQSASGHAEEVELSLGGQPAEEALEPRGEALAIVGWARPAPR